MNSLQYDNKWHSSELTYCTNVHPGNDLDQVNKIIYGPLKAVRNQRQLTTMSGGLWLSNKTAQSLLSKDNLQQFAEHLDQNGIVLFTLNGFPAQDFHSCRVKETVYQPDWSEPERLDYTINLAQILSVLLPVNINYGTISTVPLGFFSQWSEAKQLQALSALCQCVLELDKIKKNTQKTICLCLEMEPGCEIEDTDRLVYFFTSELTAYAKSIDLNPQLINQYLGICFDVCHQAVMFEDTYKALEKIHNAGITIGKIQVSSALELKKPNDIKARSTLSNFIEEKYLHQSCCKIENGVLLKTLDLDQALEIFPDNYPWRVHFHVPIQAQHLLCEGLTTTQDEIGRTLDFLQDHPEVHPHIEVETYTWTALPEEIRPLNNEAIVKGLSAELFWLEQQMLLRGLIKE